LSNAHKTALIQRMLRDDPLDGKPDEERSEAIHNKLKTCTAEVATNPLLLHAFVSEQLLHEVSSEAIQFDGRIVSDAAEYVASFPGIHTDEWDRVTLVLISKSVACVFLPETSKLYGEHCGEAEKKGLCYCQTFLYHDAPPDVQRDNLEMIMHEDDVYVGGEEPPAVGRKVEVRIDMPGSGVQKWWVCTVREGVRSGTTHADEIKLSFDGLGRAMKPRWVKMAAVNKSGDRVTSQAVGQAPFGCEWFRRWKELVDEGERLGQHATVVYKKGHLGLQTFTGLGASQLKEVLHLERTYPGRYGIRSTVRFESDASGDGSGSHITWDEVSGVRVAACTSTAAELGVAVGMQLVAVDGKELGDLNRADLREYVAGLLEPGGGGGKLELTFKTPGYAELDAEGYAAKSVGEITAPAVSDPRRQATAESAAKLANGLAQLVEATGQNQDTGKGPARGVDELNALIDLLCDSLSEFDVAQHLTRRVHDAAQESGGAELASAQTRMAAVLLKKGDLDGAMAMFEKALGIRIKTLGEEHSDVGATYNNMAEVLQSKGDLDGAWVFFTKAAAVYRRCYGADHEETKDAEGRAQAPVSLALWSFFKGKT
jgi:hypothetical protein